MTWEELFEAWREAGATDPVALFVLDELEHLVLTSTGRMMNFNEILPSLQNDIATTEHQAHYEFVARLYSAFRGDLPYVRIRVMKQANQKGPSWVGYYFLNGTKVWGWYGFVSPSIVREVAGEPPAFIMGVNFDVPVLDGKVFERIPFKLPQDFHQEANYWRIRLNAGWANLSRCQEALRPLHEAVKAPVRGSNA